MNTTTKEVSRNLRKPSILLAIVLIFLGALAIALPLATSLVVVIVIGWLILLSGATQLVHAFQSKGIGHTIWKLLVGVFYLLVGIYLISHPGLGMLGATLTLAIFFFAEGLTDLVAYFSTHKTGRSSWLLLDSVVTVALGIMIWNRWPLISFWILGVFAGINMLMTGVTRLMMALAVSKLTRGESIHPIQQNRAA
jgi:uncharacterized membrane protein HdeD (DUF308 family)